MKWQEKGVVAELEVLNAVSYGGGELMGRVVFPYSFFKNVLVKALPSPTHQRNIPYRYSNDEANTLLLTCQGFVKGKTLKALKKMASNRGHENTGTGELQ